MHIVTEMEIRPVSCSLHKLSRACKASCLRQWTFTKIWVSFCALRSRASGRAEGFGLSQFSRGNNQSAGTLSCQERIQTRCGVQSGQKGADQHCDEKTLPR